MIVRVAIVFFIFPYLADSWHRQRERVRSCWHMLLDG